ncbi:Flp family type IVb pilin [Pararhizobium sp. BT-229]|uniref:Flp family type IVb pilin n=1 Tax=Pararhizobium sp. BT-229 TaxID=2986923 RepID=UPI0021F6A4C2|nr:Flp family type IVb pilin [Pararhizobium sp. BT-229]MCV9967579.1 Flp family type IVb pilin [Pararhizobium sp. BT-229]
MKKLFRFVNDKSGATAVEYGLLCALVSVGMIAGLTEFSDALLLVLDKVSTAISGSPY